MIVKSLWPKLMTTSIKQLNYSQCIVSDTWLPNGKIEKTTVQLPFLLFIQFSAIEIRLSLFSRKACDKFITMTGKKVGCPYLLVSYSYF